MLRRLRTVLEMIKIEHTLFALPFAVVGAIYAAAERGQALTLGEALAILGAMVGARSAAMTFNRIADHRIDAANPRTAGRALPKGLLSLRFAGTFLAASLALFIASAALLNATVLALSPVAVAIILGYSYTKRFTPLSHWVLGLCLAMAPVGAWLAVRPDPFPPPLLPLLLGGGVLFWVAGFDILYACEDVEFDRRTGLKSVPARVGVRAALRVAAGCHLAALSFLAAPLAIRGLGVWYAAAIGAIALLLIYEHALVRPDDLRRVNQAFFRVNAVIGITLMTGALLDLMTR